MTTAVTESRPSLSTNPDNADLEVDTTIRVDVVARVRKNSYMHGLITGLVVTVICVLSYAITLLYDNNKYHVQEIIHRTVGHAWISAFTGALFGLVALKLSIYIDRTLTADERRLLLSRFLPCTSNCSLVEETDLIYRP